MPKPIKLFAFVVTLALVLGVPVAVSAEGEKPVEETAVIPITGEIVVVSTWADGSRTHRSTPIGPVARGFAAQVQDEYDATAIVRSAKLDEALFDVNYLVEESYHERAALPVIVAARDLSDAAALAVMVDSMGGTVARTYNHLPLIAVELPYGIIGYLSQALEGHPYTEKVWLDRVVRPSLDSSVPLIGVPALWDLGYRGQGIEIAILDTGVDDLATTTDPKVVREVNFTDDPNADDISTSGHGTHVAGTAAGTGET